MKDFLNNLYNGILRFSPLRKHLRVVSGEKGVFSKLGYLDNTKKVQLENLLGIKINKIEYFEQALTHRSYLHVIEDNSIYSNERLEFLGDSVLGMVVADYLFSLHSDVLEGGLTKMRSWMVNKNSLVECAKRLKLNEMLLMSYSASKALEQGSDSILADALEAIIGAIYLDSGLETTKKFIINVLIPIIVSQNYMVDRNYKSLLLETVQSMGKEPPKYMVLDETGQDHNKEFLVGVLVDSEIMGTGLGKSKKQAEQFAAKEALEKIKKESDTLMTY
ncbi:MAG: ribonuclease III [Candidatus Kapabacteria bacterium]|nr:ribonuclease III [Candidatus Kapabacteria bacterium]